MEKKDQPYLIAKRRKNIIKIRTEMNEIKNRDNGVDQEKKRKKTQDVSIKCVQFLYHISHISFLYQIKVLYQINYASIYQ